MERGNGISTLKVAGTYIGTVVGAGFASGQEVLQFFVNFGNAGFAGLLIVTFLFIVFGYIIMELGRKLNAVSHLDIVRFSAGRYLGGFADIVITFFLFGSLTAMMAGSGALFSQQFHVHPLIGSFLMAAISMATVLSGFNNIVNSISFVVPFLIISAIGISIASLLIAPETTAAYTIIPETGVLRNWLWSAILYTSYNTVISIAILGPLGAKAKDKKTIKRGAVLGGLGLGIGAAALFLAVRANIGLIGNLEVPMIFIAGRISPVVQSAYGIILLAEIYTTAVGDLYGFTARISSTRNVDMRNTVIISVLLAWGASLFGFSNMVKYLYPLVGYAGIMILASLLYCRQKKPLDKTSLRGIR